MGAREQAISREELAITLFEESGDALFLFDPDSEALIDVNPMAERLSGFGYAELLAMDVTYLFRSPVQGAMKRLRGAFKATGLFHSQEDFLLRNKKDGVWLPVNVTATRLHTRARTLGLITARDISDRRRLEEELRQAQKMEALGRLSGGIAHDFNNLLTVIIGRAELTLAMLSGDHLLHANVEEIKKAADRASEMTGQLLAFSRKQVVTARVLDLNAAIADMKSMLHRLIGEDIELLLNLKADAARITADPGQIQQLILNLAVNARDAMPQGGKLALATANTVADKNAPADLPAGEHVMLTVSDTGCGMSDQVKSHLFEPFFTTKAAGKGTGLGLSTVYGIVTQNRGKITVTSTPGQGATFKVFLPLSEKPEASPATPAAGSCQQTGSETILLVEDETMVRSLVRTVLARSGYKILEAAGGAEASRLSAQYAEPIHLLITDIVMPGMSGRELAEKLGPLRPDMKVLFLSGYTDDDILRRGVLKAPDTFLAKPFTASALNEKVRTLLAGAGTAQRGTSAAVLAPV